jgi:selenocysteine lyase/cysteine desulfurase
MTADAGPLDGNAPQTDLELDLGFVRAQFPAFATADLQGWAHFENAAGSFVCHQVIDRLTTFYTEFKVQPYAPYPASQTAGEWMDEAYGLMAGWLNVAEDEVHFGPSTTMNVYVLANALRPMWTDGDEIIVTNQDHEANSGAWRRLVERGINVTEWAIDPDTGLLDVADLDRLLTERVRLVAFPHASNVIAHLNPVAEIAAKARAVGAVTVVDGVSYAPHGLPDVAALGADIYLFSTYKTWGPHLGVMTIRRELLDRMANQSHFFNAGKPRYTMTPAGPDHAQIAAAAGVIHYLDAVYEHHAGGAGRTNDAAPAERARVVHDLFRHHEQRLLAPLGEWLVERNDVRVLGPLDPAVRAPTVALVPEARPVDEVVANLVDHKLMVASGNFYAARPLQAMGIDLDPGVLRLSFVHYTSSDDIERLIQALDQVLPSEL